MACTTSRTAVVHGRPAGVAAGMSGATMVHAISGRSGGSRAPWRALPRGSPEGHYLTTQSTVQRGFARAHRLSAALSRRKSLIYPCVYLDSIMGCQGVRRTRTFCRAQQSSITPGHLWCLLAMEAQHTITRDKLKWSTWEEKYCVPSSATHHGWART